MRKKKKEKNQEPSKLLSTQKTRGKKERGSKQFESTIQTPGQAQPI